MPGAVRWGSALSRGSVGVLSLALTSAPVWACGTGREEAPSVAAPPDVAAMELAQPSRSSPPSPATNPATRPTDPSRELVPSPSNRPGEPWTPGPDDTPPTHFEGRRIAQTMSYLGASWLTRADRDAEEDTAQLHQALGLRPGQTACDVGSGNGYHTVRMARAVGPSGRVLAVDVQPQMLALLRARVEQAALDNVEIIEGRPGDPRLPPGACDLILLVDVYHELAWPEPMLAAFRRALAVDGRLALVEFRAEDPKVPIKRLHKMSKAQIERELAPRGFVLVESFDQLPWQHLVFYRRDGGRGGAPSDRAGASPPVVDR